MTERDELTYHAWNVIAPLLPLNTSIVGRGRRQVLDQVEAIRDLLRVGRFLLSAYGRSRRAPLMISTLGCVFQLRSERCPRAVRQRFHDLP